MPGHYFGEVQKWIFENYWRTDEKRCPGHYSWMYGDRVVGKPGRHGDSRVWYHLYTCEAGGDAGDGGAGFDIGDLIGGGGCKITLMGYFVASLFMLHYKFIH